MSVEKTEYYIKLSEDVISSNLSPAAVKVLAGLESYARGQGECWPSQRSLAGRVKLSERHLRRSLVELQAAGLVKSKPGTGRSPSTYFLSSVVGRGSPPRVDSGVHPQGRGSPPWVDSGVRSYHEQDPMNQIQRNSGMPTSELSGDQGTSAAAQENADRDMLPNTPDTGVLSGRMKEIMAAYNAKKGN